MEKQERARVCPICGDTYAEEPALSRRKGIGEICPDCGTLEALIDYIEADNSGRYGETSPEE